MKNQFSILFFLILTAFSFFSCERLDGETVVEGQVVDWQTGNAIPYATVGVYSHPNTLAFTWIDTKEFEKQTDGNGNFSFRFEGEESKGYDLQAFINKGGYTINSGALIISTGRNNKKLKLKLRNPSWLKVKLTNQLPKDTVSLSMSPLNNGSDLQLDMLMRDTTIFALVAGFETRQINWGYTNSRGVRTTGSEQITYPNPDTVSLEIKY